MKLLLKALAILLLLSQTMCPAAHIIDSDDETEETSVKTVVDYNRMLIDGVNEQNLEKVKLSIKNKASVESINNEGKSALALACKLKNSDIVNLLLENGAILATARTEFNNIANEWDNIYDSMNMSIPPLVKTPEYINKLNYIKVLRKLILANLEYYELNFDPIVETRYHKIMSAIIFKFNEIDKFCRDKRTEREITKYSKHAATCCNRILDRPRDMSNAMFSFALVMFIKLIYILSPNFNISKIKDDDIVQYCTTIFLSLVYYGAILKGFGSIKNIFKKLPNRISLNSSDKEIIQYFNHQDAFGMNTQMWIILFPNIHSINHYLKSFKDAGITQDPTTTNINGESPIMLASKHDKKLPSLLEDLTQHFDQVIKNLKQNLQDPMIKIIALYLYGLFDPRVFDYDKIASKK